MLRVASEARARLCIVALHTSPIAYARKARQLLDAGVVDLLFADEMDASELLGEGEEDKVAPPSLVAGGESAAKAMLTRWSCLGCVVVSTRAAYVMMLRSLSAVALRGDVSSLTSHRWMRCIKKARAMAVVMRLFRAGPNAHRADVGGDVDGGGAVLEAGARVLVRCIGDVIIDGVVKQAHNAVHPTIYTIVTAHGELQLPDSRVYGVERFEGAAVNAVKVSDNAAPSGRYAPKQPLSATVVKTSPPSSTPTPTPSSTPTPTPSSTPTPTPLCLILPRTKRKAVDEIGVDDAFVG
eukprot:6144186-Pleurochrysis_carterae.AAC.1